MKGRAARAVTPRLMALQNRYVPVWTEKLRYAVFGPKQPFNAFSNCFLRERFPSKAPGWEVDKEGVAALAEEVQQAWGRFQELTARSLQKKGSGGGSSIARSSSDQQQEKKQNKGTGGGSNLLPALQLPVARGTVDFMFKTGSTQEQQEEKRSRGGSRKEQQQGGMLVPGAEREGQQQQLWLEASVYDVLEILLKAYTNLKKDEEYDQVRFVWGGDYLGEHCMWHLKHERD